MDQGIVYMALLFLPLMCAFCVIGYNEHSAEGFPTSMYLFSLSMSWSTHFSSCLKETCPKIIQSLERDYGLSGKNLLSLASWNFSSSVRFLIFLHSSWFEEDIYISVACRITGLSSNEDCSLCLLKNKMSPHRSFIIKLKILMNT